MKYADGYITSVANLVEQLKNHVNGIDAPVWFRGQSKKTWYLVPKLLRQTSAHSEVFLINKFKQNATLLLSNPPISEFEWLCLMQHYSMPTRLLDWSESPLVALYFAVYENINEDGTLWVLFPTVLNEKSNYRPDYHLEIPSFNDELLKSYLPETIAGEHRSQLFPLAVIAQRNSARMQAQQGVFTISHRLNTPLEDVGADGASRDHIWRYIIPATSKTDIGKELKMLGFSRFQLFPELDSLAL